MWANQQEFIPLDLVFLRLGTEGGNGHEDRILSDRGVDRGRSKVNRSHFPPFFSCKNSILGPKNNCVNLGKFPSPPDLSSLG